MAISPVCAGRLGARKILLIMIYTFKPAGWSRVFNIGARFMPAQSFIYGLCVSAV